MPERPRCDCGQILYRSILKKMLEDGQIGPSVFHLLPRDTGELSTWRSALYGWHYLGGVKHVLSLHTGRVRSLELEVYADEDPPQHASIVGLPDPYASEESFRAANRMGQKLLEMARPVEKVPAPPTALNPKRI